MRADSPECRCLSGQRVAFNPRGGDELPSERKRPETFFGWHVVVAAFVLAFFGWGMGFYAPPIFLSVLHDRESWPVSLISAAITTHFLVGAVAAGKLPALYRRHGALAPTRAGALCLALGAVGCAVASAPWRLFVAATLSGMGWAAMGAVAVNGIVSPWFVLKRPAALAFAYNGGSVGGAIFSPPWVAAISVLGLYLPRWRSPALRLSPCGFCRAGCQCLNRRSIAANPRRYSWWGRLLGILVKFA